MSKLTYVLLFAMLVSTVQAQNSYRAIFSGGRAYLAADNKYVQIQNGQLIAADAEVELVGDALVVLMDEAGRLTRLSLAGKYKLKGLKAPADADSALFIKSVWDTYYENAGKKNTATSMLEQQARDSEWTSFELLMPSSTQFYGNDLTLQWSDMKEPYYQLQLINEFGEVFEQFTVKEPAAAVNLGNGKLAWKDEVTIRVKRAGTEKATAYYSLDRLSPPDYEKLERLIEQHFKEEGFEMALTKAAFFENEWLFADAITILYGLRKEKGELMKSYWQQYLLRNGFYYTSKL